MTTMTERKALRRWTHAGLNCAMIDSEIGFVNGYVQLPPDHFAYALGYDTLNRAIRVHGGLTYAGGDGWVGFDTGHSGDYWPGMEQSRMFGHAERTWDLERLAAEVESLADQLATLTGLPEPTDTWECTDEEFRVLRRQARAWRRVRNARRAVRA